MRHRLSKTLMALVVLSAYWLLAAVPLAAQVESATVKINGMT